MRRKAVLNRNTAAASGAHRGPPRGCPEGKRATVPVPGSFFTSSFNFTGMLFVYHRPYAPRVTGAYTIREQWAGDSDGPTAAQETPKPTLKASVKVRDEFS